MIITTPKPHTPALPITAESTLAGAIATRSDILFCVPTFIEVNLGLFYEHKCDNSFFIILKEWSRDPECVKHLKRTKGVVSANGSCLKGYMLRSVVVWRKSFIKRRG